MRAVSIALLDRDFEEARHGRTQRITCNILVRHSRTVYNLFLMRPANNVEGHEKNNLEGRSPIR